MVCGRHETGNLNGNYVDVAQVDEEINSGMVVNELRLKNGLRMLS